MEQTNGAAGVAGPTGCVDGPGPRAQDLNDDGSHKPTCECEVCKRAKAATQRESKEPQTNGAPTNGAGMQGGKVAIEPFKRTNAIQNAKGEWIAWDLIEAFARENGVAAASRNFEVTESSIHSRKERHKWKKIPDARALSKRNIAADAELLASGSDVSAVIGRHRASVYEKTAESIAKFKAKAPKNFRELEIADRTALRALGVDSDAPKQGVLIQINEQIASHEAAPIEAHEVHTCDPEPLHQEPLSSDAGQQGTTPQTPAPKESDTPKENSAPLTLNLGDNSRRQFVLP